MDNYREIWTTLLRLCELIGEKEYCILIKDTNKFYARTYNYFAFGQCEIIDRELNWISFDKKTKTITLI